METTVTTLLTSSRNTVERTFTTVTIVSSPQVLLCLVDESHDTLAVCVGIWKELQISFYVLAM